MFRLVLAPLLTSMLCASAQAEIDHTVSLSVVQVHATGVSGSAFFGSGVVIGKDKIATNCHVTRGARSIYVSKGAFQSAVVSQQVDMTRDVCILNVANLELTAAKLGSVNKLKTGQPTYLYGYPRGIGIAFSSGKIVALHPYNHSRIIETSANFTLGASGGGIFDRNGRLIGLPTFVKAGHSHYYAIPIDWVKEVSQSPLRPVEPVGGLSFWEDTARLPAFLRRPGR